MPQGENLCCKMKIVQKNCKYGTSTKDTLNKALDLHIFKNKKGASFIFILKVG
jgi:hypothetical protein